MFQYQPRADLKDKNIAVFASIYPGSDKHQKTLEILKSVVDTVIDESTCRILTVNQSVSNPDHFMLYEEWSDYDEFFTVQLKRNYRQGFAEKLGTVRDKPSTFEFFEIMGESIGESTDVIEANSTDYENNTCVVTRLRLKEEFQEDGESGLTNFPAFSENDDDNLSCKLFRSLNDPLLFVIYDVCIDKEYSQDRVKDYVIASCFREFFNNDNVEKQQIEIFQTRYIPTK